jgi:hypothetical protein
MLSMYTDREPVRSIKIKTTPDLLRSLAVKLEHKIGLNEARTGEYVSVDFAPGVVLECLVEKKPMLSTKIDETADTLLEDGSIG